MAIIQNLTCTLKIIVMERHTLLIRCIPLILKLFKSFFTLMILRCVTLLVPSEQFIRSVSVYRIIFN